MCLDPELGPYPARLMRSLAHTQPSPPLISTIIDLRVIDRVSSPLWWGRVKCQHTHSCYILDRIKSLVINMILFCVWLTSGNFNRQLMQVTHYLCYLLNIDVSPVCWWTTTVTYWPPTRPSGQIRNAPV